MCEVEEIIKSLKAKYSYKKKALIWEECVRYYIVARRSFYLVYRFFIRLLVRKKFN